MRIARNTLILAIIFCLVGCGIKNKEKETVTAENEETVNVPAIKECKATQESGDYSITEYDRDGNKLKVTDYDKDGNINGIDFENSIGTRRQLTREKMENEFTEKYSYVFLTLLLT